jgi:hypothetical protein
MPQVIHVLTQQEISVLKAMAKDWRATVRNTQNRTGPEGTVPYAPEVYVALTPMGGIPGIGTEAEDVGTGSGTGSGSGGFDDPGHADCNIFQLIRNLDDGSADLDPIASGLQLTVYNLGFGAIPGNIFIPVMREKGGGWLAIMPPIDTSQEVVTSVTCVPGPGTGSGSTGSPRLQVVYQTLKELMGL